MDKITVSIIIFLVVVLGLFLVFSGNHTADDTNRTTLNVSSEGPVELSQLINEIKTQEYYKGFDNETLKWMESLGVKYVWIGNDEIVIMGWWDSNKIPSVYVCDVYYQELFSCNVIENRSLGNGDNFTNVLLVSNVEYIGEEVHDLGLV